MFGAIAGRGPRLRLVHELATRVVRYPISSIALALYVILASAN